MSHFQYAPAPASFAGGTTIDALQLGSWEIDPGVNADEIVPAGQLLRKAVIMGFAAPKARITTNDIDKFFATISPTVGYNCSSGASFRAIQRADNSTYTGGSSNYKCASTNGYLVPESITVSQDKPAVLDLTYYPFSSDGKTYPLISTLSNALSVTPAFGSQFYLGPVYINDSLIEAVSSVKINFGIGFQCYRGSGDVFCQKGYVTSQMPSVEFGFDRPDLVPTNVNAFMAAAAGQVDVYLQRGAASATRVAANGTTHFWLSSPTGVLKTGSLGGQGLANVNCALSYFPTSAIATSLASNIPH